MRRIAVIAGCVLAMFATAAGSAHAASAQQTIALLNAQRGDNGLPANIMEDPRLTSDCAAHDRYMSLNHVLTHFEQQGNPGYTLGGAFAGKNAVLTEGGNWDNGNPYESAPLHLDQLLAPRLTSLGSADLDGFSCTTTFPGLDRSRPGGRDRLHLPRQRLHDLPERDRARAALDPWAAGGNTTRHPHGPLPVRACRRSRPEPVRQSGDPHRRDTHRARGARWTTVPLTAPPSFRAVERSAPTCTPAGS